MMGRDLHGQPFDDATETKLEIFERYLEAWLMVFTHTSYFNNAIIVDFFAGPGKDSSGRSGSPLIILETLAKHENLIKDKNFKITVLFNEIDVKKYEELKENVKECNACHFCEIRYSNKDFRQIFNQLSKEALKETPALLFMDQCGIKHIPQDVFLTLNSFQRADFLFYISSSFFNRFASDSSFQKYFPGIGRDDLRKKNYHSIHRIIYDQYKKMIPEKSNLKLYQFSIKRYSTASINGLIFGTKHILGAQKFLDIVWKKNRINGDANFDIDDDHFKMVQRPLFQELQKKTKKDLFKEQLQAYIAEKKVVSNKDIYVFTLEKGFHQTLANESIKEMIDNGVLKKLFEGRGLYIGYDRCIKEKKTFNFMWTGEQ